MSRLIGVLTLVLVLAAGPAGATEIFEKVGTIGGQFLKIGIGARASAMGHQESVLEALLTGIVLYFLVLRLDRL